MAVSFTACVINLPSAFAYNLDLSNYAFESGLSYFRELSSLVGLFYECCRMSML